MGDFPQYVLMYVAGLIAYRQNWLAAVEIVQRKGLWIALECRAIDCVVVL